MLTVNINVLLLMLTNIVICLQHTRRRQYLPSISTFNLKSQMMLIPKSCHFTQILSRVKQLFKSPTHEQQGYSMSSSMLRIDYLRKLYCHRCWLVRSLVGFLDHQHVTTCTSACQDHTPQLEVLLFWRLNQLRFRCWSCIHCMINVLALINSLSALMKSSPVYWTKWRRWRRSYYQRDSINPTSTKIAATHESGAQLKASFFWKDEVKSAGNNSPRVLRTVDNLLGEAKSIQKTSVLNWRLPWLHRWKYWRQIGDYISRSADFHRRTFSWIVSM